MKDFSTKYETPCLIELAEIGLPELGYIAIAENSKLPFEIKRVYWTYYTPESVTRGNHAHRQLRQIVFAVHGAVQFSLENGFGDKMNYSLDNPAVGLFIPELHWRTMGFSHDAVLLCLASAEYDESDYIRDFTEFKNLSK